MLSGEILGHFGGFFDETLRRNDFDLGYASTLQWLEAGGLDGLGLTALQIETALDSARGAYLPGDGWKQTGETTVGSLFRKHPWLAVRLALKIGRVLLHDLLHHRKP
jgi:hypothetical protein